MQQWKDTEPAGVELWPLPELGAGELAKEKGVCIVVANVNTR